MTELNERSPDGRYVIDTQGEVNFKPSFAIVVVTEIVVLTALWFFSRHFGA